ncbi:MAG: putative ABC transporter permease [Butyrivibrio sp.]|nr:putative ABC transporter permease [Acetatifactor muris]MCM1559992.1 putative ABC transporter permease [Butyrivibrio sp.]
MKQNTVNFTKNFLKCGLIGWCMEILFTALGSLRSRDFTLKGVTSVWMFPIYGCAAVIAPLSRLLQNRPVWFRGLTYMSIIFSAEYLTGSLLSRHRLCPWNYGRSRWNINRIIRLDYAPCWFGAGLLFERLLNSSPGESD